MIIAEFFTFSVMAVEFLKVLVTKERLSACVFALAKKNGLILFKASRTEFRFALQDAESSKAESAAGLG